MIHEMWYRHESYVRECLVLKETQFYTTKCSDIEFIGQ